MSTLPNTHALLIDIAGYQQVNRLSQQVRNDVQDLHAALIDPQLYAYPPEKVTLGLESLPLSWSFLHWSGESTMVQCVANAGVGYTQLSFVAVFSLLRQGS